MFLPKLVKAGKLDIEVIDFPTVGGLLPMHEHDDTSNHITIVARGSLIARGGGWELVVSAGDVLDWEANDPHEFEAREANSRIVNIRK